MIWILSSEFEVWCLRELGANWKERLKLALFLAVNRTRFSIIPKWLKGLASPNWASFFYPSFLSLPASWSLYVEKPFPDYQPHKIYDIYNGRWDSCIDRKVSTMTTPETSDMYCSCSQPFQTFWSKLFFSCASFRTYSATLELGASHDILQWAQAFITVIILVQSVFPPPPVTLQKLSLSPWTCHCNLLSTALKKLPVITL